MTFPTVLCFALLLDVLLGDPHALPHPVVGVGRLIRFWEGRLYPGAGAPCAVVRGAGLCVLVLLSTLAVVAGLLWAAGWGGGLATAIEVYLLYAALAWRSLKDETMPVALALFRRNLPGARTALSRVVGRDTENLDAPSIVRGAVETVAENSVDGVMSVLFFAALGWAVGEGAGMALAVWGFKAVSTMDSMVGYENARYREFGRAAARLDDALNFIPARLGGLAILAAGACLGMDAGEGMRVFLRDRKKHKSPNSAHGESAFAGLLGLRLGGSALYGGVAESRPYLGDGAQTPEAADVLRAHRLLDAASALFALLCALPFRLA